MARTTRPQSAISIEFTRRVHAMEQAGISHAEIARRSGISRDFTNRIARGTRRASDRTAEAALQRLGSEDFAERRVVLKGEPNPIWVAPIRYRDFEKISAWQIAVHQARENADYRSLRHFPRSALEIRIAGSNGQSRRVRLETDPEALRALDDAGELSGGEWRRGPSPSIASSRVAA